MPKNNKAKGARRELQVKHRLEKEGFMGVKSGGSLGEFDLVMMRSGNPGSLLLIQVKSNRPPPPKERQAIADCVLKTGDVFVLEKQIVVIKDYQPKHIITVVE